MKPIKRHEWLVECIKAHNFKSVVEIGVLFGTVASYVIKECDLDAYIMVEPYVQPKLYDAIIKSDALVPSVDPPRLKYTAKPIILMRMTSENASRYIADKSIDIVFIDALHGYKYVKKDIQCWLPKVKKAGIISGHDYFPDLPNVKRAVDETFDNVNLFCEEPDSPHGGNHVWWTGI